MPSVPGDLFFFVPDNANLNSALVKGATYGSVGGVQSTGADWGIDPVAPKLGTRALTN